MLVQSTLFVAALPFLVWGIVAHLIADWLLQSLWMAQYKTDLKHPASWVHAGIHSICERKPCPLWAWRNRNK